MLYQYKANRKNCLFFVQQKGSSRGKGCLSRLTLKRSGCYLTDIVRISSKREAERDTSNVILRTAMITMIIKRTWRPAAVDKFAPHIKLYKVRNIVSHFIKQSPQGEF
jgi:hypothetical protein